MTRLDLGLFLSVSLLWSLSFLFMRVGVPEMGTYTFAGLRIVIAASAMLFFGLLLRRINYRNIQANLAVIAVNAIFNLALPFPLFSYATGQLSAGLASTINVCAPLISVLMAHFIFSERISRSQALGLLISFVGILLLSLPKILDKPANFLGILAGLIACVSYAISINITRKYAKGLDSFTLTTLGLLLASLFLLPLIIWDYPNSLPSLKAWLSVIAIALFSTALAFLLYYKLLFRVGIAKCVGSVLLVPVFSNILSILFLGETLGWLGILGTLVTLLGAYGVLFARRA